VAFVDDDVIDVNG